MQKQLTRGFAIIEKAEKEKKVSQLQIFEFSNDCQAFLKAMAV